MITFKQFLAERAMNRSAYDAAIARIGHDVLMGFEFEVFVPKDSHFYDEASESDTPFTDVNSLDSMGDFSSLFVISRGARSDIETEYADWGAEHESTWIDEHWEDYLDDDEVEQDGLRAAEATARNEATNHYPAPRWAEWFHDKFDNPLEFIDRFNMTPQYGWAEEGVSVYDTEPTSQGYHENWKVTARQIANRLQEVLKLQVVVNTNNRKMWNLVHDTSIKDDEGNDYESDQNGVGVEIISPPEPYETAMKHMHQVFDFIAKYGMSTNESTGLHVNISIPNISGRLDALKLVLFMGDKRTLAEFERLHNTFTASQMQAVIDGIEETGSLPKTFPELKAAADAALKKTGKYYTVNLDKLRSGYLEFRAIGGQGYHTKAERISETIGRWIYSVELATEPSLARKEYLKKVVKLLGKTATARLDYEKKELSFEDLAYKASSMTWQAVEDAAEGSDQTAKVRALRGLALAMTGSPSLPKNPTYKQAKEAISLFKRMGVTVEDVLNATPNLEAKAQVKRFGELFKLK